mgnify:CR=1 FL=1
MCVFMVCHCGLQFVVEADRPLRKTTQLKRMLTSPELEFIMEAHNGLSAKIVQEAGFKVNRGTCTRLCVRFLMFSCRLGHLGQRTIHLRTVGCA